MMTRCHPVYVCKNAAGEVCDEDGETQKKTVGESTGICRNTKSNKKWLACQQRNLLRKSVWASITATRVSGILRDFLGKSLTLS